MVTRELGSTDSKYNRKESPYMPGVMYSCKIYVKECAEFKWPIIRRKWYMRMLMDGIPPN